MQKKKKTKTQITKTTMCFFPPILSWICLYLVYLVQETSFVTVYEEMRRWREHLKVTGYPRTLQNLEGKQASTVP